MAHDPWACSLMSGASPAVAPFRLPRLALPFAGPPTLAGKLMFGLRLWASVVLALWIAFALELDNPYWAATSAAIVCQPALGASLRKSRYRLIGTVAGAVAIVVMTACFPQDRLLFLAALALWTGACGFAATLLRNFAAYAASLAGFTAAIIAADQLGQVGGLDGHAFLLALDRTAEIGIGIVSAGIVLAGTDLGQARARLAQRFAETAASIAAGAATTLREAGPELPDMRAARRTLIRAVAALDPAIDEAVGESSEIRQRSPVLQAAMHGLFDALGAWRALANHLLHLPPGQAADEAGRVLAAFPPLPPAAGWRADPLALHAACRASATSLRALETSHPSLRMLADRAAILQDGLAAALAALALLAGAAAPADPVPRAPSLAPVADWLPAWINFARCAAVPAGVALLWIVTAWPGGAGALTWATITMVLFAPRAAQSYEAALDYMLGTVIGCGFAAVWAFALLPALPTQNFVVLAAMLGLYLVPAGALMAQPRHTGLFVAMTVNFPPLLEPANPMRYNDLAFYNGALGILAGIFLAMASMRLLPPLSAAIRTRRLLALSLRDLRRVAGGTFRGDWRHLCHARLAACPPEASRLEHAQLLAARSAGLEIRRLRTRAVRLGATRRLESALARIEAGESEPARRALAALASTLAAQPGSEALRARAALLALQDVLRQHETFFDTRLPA